MCAVPDIAVAVDNQSREEVVLLEGVLDLVLSRMDPTNTKSRQLADAHGLIRIPDNELEGRVVGIEIEGDIESEVEQCILEDKVL